MPDWNAWQREVTAAVDAHDWDRYDALLAPYRALVPALRRGDADALPGAVDYVLARPRFFRSGYLWEDLVSALAAGPEADRRDLHRVVLDAARHDPNRETRRVARLAARYWDASLAKALAALDTPAARALTPAQPSPVATGRSESADHCDQEPG